MTVLSLLKERQELFKVALPGFTDAHKRGIDVNVMLDYRAFKEPRTLQELINSLSDRRKDYPTTDLFLSLVSEGPGELRLRNEDRSNGFILVPHAFLYIAMRS